MSDRSKHFADEDRQGKEENEKRQLEVDAEKAKLDAMVELFEAAKMAYRSEFEAFRLELKAERVSASVLEVPSPVRVIEPDTWKGFQSTAAATITIVTRKSKTEFALLLVDQPSPLCMLGWRKDDQKHYFKVIGSAVPPQEVLSAPTVVRKHLDAAVMAARTG
ncbi:hypothetical protein ACMHYB_18015 [Sorangium sp. So ce1128]